MDSSPTPPAPAPQTLAALPPGAPEIPPGAGNRGVTLWTLFLAFMALGGCYWAWKSWTAHDVTERHRQVTLVTRVLVRTERWVCPGDDSNFTDRHAQAILQIAEEENLSDGALRDVETAFLARVKQGANVTAEETALAAFLRQDFAAAAKLQPDVNAPPPSGSVSVEERSHLVNRWMLAGASKWEQSLSEESEKCFQQAVAQADHGQDPLIWAAALHELGIAQWSGRHFDAAVSSFHKALPALEEATGGKGVEVDTLLYHLGKTLAILWRQSEATMVLKRSLDLRERRLRFDELPVAEVLDVIGQVQHDGADDETAEQTWRRALAIRQKKSDAHDVHLTIAQHHLALALAGLSRAPEAIALLREALETQEKVLHADESVVAPTLAALGKQLVIHTEGNEGELLLRRATALAGKAFDPDSLALADVTEDWTAFLMKSRQYDEAMQALDRILVIREKVLGPQHPLCGITRVTRGLCMLGQQKAPESEEEMRKALEIQEKALGENHPVVAAACVKIAVAIEAAHRFADAEAFFKRALAILDKRFGHDHDHVPFDMDALLYSGLGVVLQAQGGTQNLDEAENLLRHGITILEKRFNSTDPRLGRVLVALANVLRTAGRDEDAADLLHRAQPLVREASGGDSMELARLLTSYGMVLSRLQRSGEAEVQLRGAMEIFQTLGSPADPSVPAAFHTLGVLLKSARNYPEAAKVLTQGLAASERILGPKAVFTAEISVDLAQVLEKQKQYPEAHARYREALETLLAASAADAPATANAQEGLGKCLVWQKNPAEGIPLLQSALESKTRRLGSRHIEVANLHTWLGHAYMDKGDAAGAEQELLIALKLHLALKRESAEVCLDERDLGILYSKINRPSDAQVHLTHAVDILKRIGSAEGVDAAQCYTYIGLGQMAAGAGEQAIGPLKEAEELAKAPGSDPDSLKYATLTLGKLYSDLGRHQESDAYLQRGIMLIQQHPGDDPDELANWINVLADNAEQAKRYPEAIRWRRLMLAVSEKIHGTLDPRSGVALARISNLLVLSKRQSVTGPILEESLRILSHANAWAAQNRAGLQDIVTNYSSYLRSTGMNEAQAKKRVSEVLTEAIPDRSAGQLVDSVLGPLQ